MTKRVLVVAVAVAALAVATAFAADDVTNSKHNLSTGGSLTTFKGGTGEVCVFCHYPHNARQAIAPLWNRNTGAATTFSMYTSATINMTISAAPTGVSAACMTCHDGQTTMGNLFKLPSDWTGNTNKITGNANLSTDLSNDHPISVTYNTNLDSDFRAAATVMSGGKARLFSDGTNWTVECGSCHNPHDVTYGKFLRANNSGSAICLGCHIK